MLEPRRYVGETDVTDSQPFWEGYLEHLWDSLFADIEAALPVERPAPAPDSAE